MSLELDKRYNYAEPCFTNWDYLHNMTTLQMIPLGEIIWTGVYIRTDLWAVPDTRSSKTDAEIATQYFITILNNKIKEL